MQIVEQQMKLYAEIDIELAKDTAKDVKNVGLE